MVCLGLHLLTKNESITSFEELQLGMSSNAMEFYIPVFPGEKVVVVSQKKYFRFHKLKCEVKMYNSANELVCKGTIAGMLKLGKNG